MPPEVTAPAAVQPPADQAPNASVATGKTPSSTTESEAQTNASQSQEETRPALDTLPKYWQDHIKDLRGENKSYRLATEQAQSEQAQKEAADLEKRQEWEKLANKRQEEINRLTPIAQDAEKLGELIKGQIDAEINKWPKEVADTHPAGEVSALTMYEWFTKMRPLAERLMAADESKAKPPAGNGPGPTPTTQASNQDSSARSTAPLVNIDRRF